MSKESQEEPVSPPEMFNKFIKWLFISAVLFAVFITLGLIKYLQQNFGKTPTSRDIGHLIHVTPAGGLSSYSMVETETGFYPLADILTAKKGTPLVLESRAWNERFVSDSPKTLCVRTTQKGFELPKVAAKAAANIGSKP